VETKQTTTTSTENELPDKDASAAVKECPKTPNREGATTKQSGIDGGGTKEIPDQIIAETAKYNQETPECKDPATIHQDNDNETPNEKFGLPDKGTTNTAKSNQITPKRKYKTEVEKLKESQNGLEIMTSRRSGMVAVVGKEVVNENESDKTQIEGDGPKTGPAH
jgi:hypothetical protein